MTSAATLRRAVILLLAASATGACAQSYPMRPVRIVTSEPGGGSDFNARVLAQGLTAALGQQVIVDNRAGVVVAAQIMQRAAPDGYTLLLYNNSLWTLPLLQSVPYDPLKDFAPIVLATRSPNILVVHPSVAAATVKELVALAKAAPGKLNYASGNVGSSNHLAAELFKAMAGVNITRIGYKGSGFAVTDLIAGHVHVMFGTAGSVQQHVKAGRLRALAVTSAQPSALVPGLPTVAATGVPGYEAVTLYGLLAPARIPAPLADRLNRLSTSFLTAAEVRQKLLTAGVEAVGGARPDYAAAMQADMARLGVVIRDAGIRAE